MDVNKILISHVLSQLYITVYGLAMKFDPFLHRDRNLDS